MSQFDSMASAVSSDSGWQLTGLTKTSSMHFDIGQLDIAPGAITAIIGPNGAGKSTLLRVLAHLESSDAEVSFAGVRLSAAKPLQRARLFSFVPQRLEVTMPYLVREVVAMGRYAWGDERSATPTVARAIEEFGLVSLANRPVTELSGGELARVFFARASAQDAPGMLLDEPTAALDIAQQQLLVARLRDYAAAGKTVVLVMHDLNLAAATADSVVLLERGRLIAQGEPRAVLTAAQIAESYGQPVSVVPHPLTGAPLITPIT